MGSKPRRRKRLETDLHVKGPTSGLWITTKNNIRSLLQ